jgi:hypothetical protein
MSRSYKVFFTGYSWCDNYQSSYVSAGGPGGLGDGTWDDPTSAAFDDKLIRALYGDSDKHPVIYLDCQLTTGKRKKIQKYVKLEDACGHTWFWTHKSVLDVILENIFGTLKQNMNTFLEGAAENPDLPGTDEYAAAVAILDELNSSKENNIKFKRLLVTGTQGLNITPAQSLIVNHWVQEELDMYCDIPFILGLIKDKETYDSGSRDWREVRAHRKTLDQLDNRKPAMRSAIEQATARMLAGKSGTKIVLDLWYGYNANILNTYSGNATVDLKGPFPKNNRILPYLHGRVLDDSTGQPIPPPDEAACKDSYEKDPATGINYPVVSNCTAKIFSKIKVSIVGDPDQTMFTTCGGQFFLIGNQSLAENDTYQAILRIEDTAGQYIDIPQHPVTVKQHGNNFTIRLRKKGPLECVFTCKVVDKNSPTTALQFVKVKVKGAGGFAQDVETGGNGAFKLTVPYGQLQLRAEYNHYLPKEASVTIDQAIQEYTIEMEFDFGL